MPDIREVSFVLRRGIAADGLHGNGIRASSKVFAAQCGYVSHGSYPFVIWINGLMD
jgi:hypothetical protein